MVQTKELLRQQTTRRIVAGTAELRAAIVDIVSRAQRTLGILTPDLETAIYEHDDFLVALKRFVLAKSFTRVRVLITEPGRAVKPGNQFVQVGQRLSSYIEFRNLPDALRPEVQAFCIADGDSIVYRANHATGEGMLAQHAPEIARLYLAEFDDLWQRS
ncbi:MAG TPA: hypothetical protein VMR74_00050 [Gammaproteobacteria bacterium]|nr:hypothetical protein [Gammaproteobacteria bacterium]